MDVTSYGSITVWIFKNAVQIDLICSCVCKILSLIQKIGSANQLIDRTHTKLCHILTHLLCNKAHEINDIFRLSAEVLTKLWVLGGYADRAGIKVAHTHHNTAHCNKRCGCKTILLCAEKCCDNHVMTIHQLSIGLKDDTVTKTIHDQGLMGFCYAKFPWKSGIVDGVSRCGTCSAVIAGYQNNLCACLCNTGCNGSNTCLGYKLNRNSCLIVCIL